MANFIQKIIFIFFLFILGMQNSYAIEPIKINNLIFDNSDGIIYINSKGITDENSTVQKGLLKDPNRIYLDINNAILTTPKKTYLSKNSVFNNIKISQFSTDPYIVRIVFEYKNFNPDLFQVYKIEDSFFIKTNKNIVNSPNFKIVYSNTKNSDRTSFYKGAKFEEEKITLSDNNEESQNIKKTNTIDDKFLKLSSKFYIDSISKTKEGILINGIGKLSLMPSFVLKEPDRLIIDLDDTVVSSELRNKTFTIGEIEINNENKINKRETLKIGQNSQNIARLVIQGENAKNYRAIISPDSKNLYLTDRTKAIEAKISDDLATLVKTSYSNQKGVETISFILDDSASIDAFEENSNLYLDINNINSFENGILDPIIRVMPEFKTVHLALDKVRFVFPNMKDKNINIKTNPDNTEIRIGIKPVIKPEVKKEPTKTNSTYTPISKTKEKPTEISNHFKVVIDAGHGGNDVGATREGIFEKDITLKISKYLEKELNKKKVKTYMVRDKDVYVSLKERSDYSNSIKPDLFVSVHVNSSTNDTSYGIETHWYKEDSRKYAKDVHNEMAKKIKTWKTVDRGLFNSKFYVINHTDAPAILCEIGFISNKSEREEIIKQKRQQEIAEAIANGIYNYLKARK